MGTGGLPGGVYWENHYLSIRFDGESWMDQNTRSSSLKWGVYRIYQRICPSYPEGKRKKRRGDEKASIRTVEKIAAR
jgi:hypothetical protein